MCVPKLRIGSFFPDDVIERHRRVDRAAVAEIYVTGTSTRRVQRVVEKMGVSRLSKDQVSAITSSLDVDVDVQELCARPLDGTPAPYVWLDATYVKCRRGGCVTSAAVVTAIGRDADGRGVLGVDVVETESHDSWLAFLREIRDRGLAAWSSSSRTPTRASSAPSARSSRAPRGSAAPVHLMRDCMREAGSWQLRRRVGRIVSQVFRWRDAVTVAAMYHAACDMLEECSPRAAAVMEEAEPKALANLDIPPTHWKRLHTNNVQERTNREIKRRSRMVQVFPSTGLLVRLAGTVMCARDETWQKTRCFSEARTSDRYDE